MEISLKHSNINSVSDIRLLTEIKKMRNWSSSQWEHRQVIRHITHPLIVHMKSGPQENDQVGLYHKNMMSYRICQLRITSLLRYNILYLSICNAFVMKGV